MLDGQPPTDREMSIGRVLTWIFLGLVITGAVLWVCFGQINGNNGSFNLDEVDHSRMDHSDSQGY